LARAAAVAALVVRGKPRDAPCSFCLLGGTMVKRSLFLAAGLLAILALAGPSQAASTRVTVDAQLGPPIPAGVTTITELDVTFTPAASPFTGLHLTSPPPVGGSSISSSGNTVKMMVSPSASATYLLAGQGFADFQFTVPVNFVTAQADDKVVSVIWKTNAGSKVGTAEVSFFSVPEPTSLALLGIGMVGFFALGWFFKRPAVA
jgi:hypothetical protein